MWLLVIFFDDSLYKIEFKRKRLKIVIFIHYQNLFPKNLQLITSFHGVSKPQMALSDKETSEISHFQR